MSGNIFIDYGWFGFYVLSLHFQHSFLFFLTVIYICTHAHMFTYSIQVFCNTFAIQRVLRVKIEEANDYSFEISSDNSNQVSLLYTDYHHWWYTIIVRYTNCSDEQVEVFWVVTPCSVGYRCFGGHCCIHLQSVMKMDAWVCLFSWKFAHGKVDKSPCALTKHHAI